MKPTAIVINTARGGIIDEKALYQALSSGALLGAGLDVFSDEDRPDFSSPLMRLDNVTVSSHLAGNTADNSVFMADHCAENIRRIATGLPLPKADFVNRQFMK